MYKLLPDQGGILTLHGEEYTLLQDKLATFCEDKHSSTHEDLTWMLC